MKLNAINRQTDTEIILETSPEEKDVDQFINIWNNAFDRLIQSSPSTPYVGMLHDPVEDEIIRLANQTRANPESLVIDNQTIAKPNVVKTDDSMIQKFNLTDDMIEYLYTQQHFGCSRISMHSYKSVDYIKKVLNDRNVELRTSKRDTLETRSKNEILEIVKSVAGPSVNTTIDTKIPVDKQGKMILTKEQLAALHTKGYSTSMIARSTGWSDSYVAQSIRSIGLDTKCQTNRNKFSVNAKIPVIDIQEVIQNN